VKSLRHSTAIEALAQVHNALVVHNDIYPRNILIVPGNPERVILIDFDIAITFPGEGYS
jgi:serine/threonine protein kinase